MSFDISELLSEWPYEHGKVMVRRFEGDDGIEKIQLRVDLGILQMNATGRPDGKKPFGHASFFDHLSAKRDALETDGQDFFLGEDECLKLQQEAIQYYHRFICLFELKDFESVVRDTERNLEVFDFIDEYADSEEILSVFDQMRPQLVMMYARAKSSLIAEEKDYPGAIALVEEGLDEIRDFYESQGMDEVVDNTGEMQFLRSWLAELQARRPMSEREKLENALEAAIQREDYEKAAEMRDAIKSLEVD